MEIEELSTQEEERLDLYFSKSDEFGQTRMFFPYVPGNKFSSVDRIEGAGWHEVNTRYQIRRPRGADCPLILFTVAGCGKVVLNGKTFVVGRNEVCMLPPGTPCAYGAYGEENWAFYWLHFSGAHAENLFQDIVDIAGNRSPFPVRTVIPLLERCLTTKFVGMRGALLASLLLHDILSELLLHFCTGSGNGGFVDDLMQYLSSDTLTHLNMDALEMRYHYSKEYIIRTFHQQTNTTPYRYWREIKLANAKQQLALLQTPIEEIARMAGYGSVESFTKQFRQHFGVTPVQYRRDNRSDASEEY